MSLEHVDEAVRLAERIADLEDRLAHSEETVQVMGNLLAQAEAERDDAREILAWHHDAATPNLDGLRAALDAIRADRDSKQAEVERLREGLARFVVWLEDLEQSPAMAAKMLVHLIRDYARSLLSPPEDETAEPTAEIVWTPFESETPHTEEGSDAE